MTIEPDKVQEVMREMEAEATVRARLEQRLEDSSYPEPVEKPTEKSMSKKLNEAMVEIKSIDAAATQRIENSEEGMVTISEIVEVLDSLAEEDERFPGFAIKGDRLEQLKLAVIARLTAWR